MSSPLDQLQKTITVSHLSKKNWWTITDGGYSKLSNNLSSVNRKKEDKAMKLKVLYFKNTGKYYGKDEFPFTDEQLENLKHLPQHDYVFGGVIEFILKHSNYHNPEQFTIVADLIDQPYSSQSCCTFLFTPDKIKQVQLKIKK